MAEYINPPTISFKLTAKGASVDTILALLQNELQTLTSDDLEPAADGAVDLSQRVSGRIVVELTLDDEESETVDPSASLTASTEAALCRGVSDVSLNVLRCRGVS